MGVSIKQLNVERKEESEIDYFLHCLKDLPYRIKDKKGFFNQIGLEYDEQWIQDIINHKLLDRRSKYEHKTVLDRLIGEFDIKELKPNSPAALIEKKSIAIVHTIDPDSPSEPSSDRVRVRVWVDDAWTPRNEDDAWTPRNEDDAWPDSKEDEKNDDEDNEDDEYDIPRIVCI